MATLIDTAPKIDLAIQDITHLVAALRDYHGLYSPLFQRREQRQAAHTYLQGLLSELPRKSIEPMVLALEGVHPNAVRAMQAFISAGTWDDEALLSQHWKEVEKDEQICDVTSQEETWAQTRVSCCSTAAIFPSRAVIRRG